MWNKLVYQPIAIAPLISFRILFGLLTLFSTIRFYQNGWINQLFIEPEFYFSFFPFIKPLPANITYLLFGIMALSSFCISLGFFYRIATTLFFLIFTYFELLDKTNYLNHYYFISLVSFILIFLPANKAISFDNLLFKKENYTHVAAFNINILKLMLGIVYFFAGIAKINPDWLLEALPLKIWLQAKYHYPIIGNLLTQEYVAYFFSWAGCIFDISIFFLLINNTTRKFGYIALIIFHVLTSWLFPIGVFPFIMISLTTIFFSTNTHQKIQHFLFKIDWNTIPKKIYTSPTQKIKIIFFSIFIIIQLILPFRYLLYKGNLFWHEQGFRFSWRVMLIEKVGYASFFIKAENHNDVIAIDNKKYLSRTQIKMFNTQPDMMVQYAHFLKEKYQKLGFKNPKVFAEIYISLNGKGSKLYNNVNIDLSSQKNNLKQKEWILQYE